MTTMRSCHSFPPVDNRRELVKHLLGQHDQKTHGHRGTGSTDQPHLFDPSTAGPLDLGNEHLTAAYHQGLITDTDVGLWADFESWKDADEAQTGNRYQSMTDADIWILMEDQVGFADPWIVQKISGMQVIAQEGQIAIDALENIYSLWTETEPRGYIRVPYPAFSEGVIVDGRLENQRGTGNSRGTFDPHLRDRVERVMFGHEEPDEAFPVYGYVAGDDTRALKPDDLWAYNPIEQYGSVVIKVRDSVPTTFTMNDSLLVHDRGDISDEENIGFVGTLREGPDVRLLAHISQVSRFPPTELRRWANAADPAVLSPRYVEAQFHQEVSWDDIEAVYVPARGILWATDDFPPDQPVTYSDLGRAGEIADMDAMEFTEGFKAIADEHGVEFYAYDESKNRAPASRRIA